MYAGQLEDNARENHFKVKIEYYDTQEELQKALDDGKVDAIADSMMRLQKDQKFIGKFDEISYYFMLRKDNKELKKEFDETVRQIMNTSPELKNELFEKYFPAASIVPLNQEEEEYVKEKKKIRVACTVGVDPLCYEDENGNPAGIRIKILDRIAEYTGLEFEYVIMPTGQLSYDDFVDQSIDVIGGAEFNYSNAKDERIWITDPYIKMEKCMIGLSGAEFEPDMKGTVGVTSGSATVESVIKRSYPNLDAVYYSSLEEALDDLQKGKIDFVMQNQYSADRALQRPKYRNLSIVAKAGIGDQQSMSVLVQGNEDSKKDVLWDILNKGITSLTNEEVDMIVMETTAQSHYTYTLSDILYEHRYAVGMLVVIFLIGGGLIYYTLRTRRKNIQLLTEQHAELEVKSKQDMLTGLLNKVAFEEACRQYCRPMERQTRCLSLWIWITLSRLMTCWGI
jgi:ABC-type amino acid transport substrate-binding protein